LFHSRQNHKSKNAIYFLGTSHRTFDQFLELFRKHDVEAGVDIRSFPTSRFSHFSRNALAQGLKSEGIQYIYLGKELGGFRKGGYLNYRASGPFKRGLQQLEEIGLEKRTAFFCAERFPWKCHRRWVAGELVERGWQVIHIIEQGKIWIPKPGSEDEGS
jgi:uncharacterized protein (DUF488 family)